MNNRNALPKLKKPFPRSQDSHPARGWWSKLLCLLLVILPGRYALADGEAFTWKDAAGRVHYGNRPPEGQEATSISVQPSGRIYTWTDAEGNVQYGAHPPPHVAAKELKEDDGSLSTIHASQLREGEKQLLQKWQRR
ncbi:MAG TPA: DUF4124 domain-containing protein [Candidatus Competibacteraceae bacterium]|nr:DUF4124 domain-containing protein [Candidatus Competibacteraceae bacterium]MCP5132177.1 DUF4124 domain-containing protein [Gammaproteobacteria bacterium]HPF58101.1 DUF4124 domain-containing protein [Candidatus Competibacteraceae bacterium]